MRRTILALAAAAMAVGCTTVQDSIHPGETAMLEANWLKPETVPRPPALYCYRTLGREDCYRTPMPEERRRLIEHYGPPPELLSY